MRPSCLQCTNNAEVSHVSSLKLCLCPRSRPHTECSALRTTGPPPLLLCSAVIVSCLVFCCIFFVLAHLLSSSVVVTFCRIAPPIAEGRQGSRGRAVHHTLRRGRRPLATPNPHRPRGNQPALGLPPRPGGRAKLVRLAGVLAARGGGEGRLGALRKPGPVEGAADEVRPEHVPGDGRCRAEVAQVPLERVPRGSGEEGKRGAATQEGVSNA